MRARVPREPVPLGRPFCLLLCAGSGRGDRARHIRRACQAHSRRGRRRAHDLGVSQRRRSGFRDDVALRREAAACGCACALYFVRHRPVVCRPHLLPVQGHRSDRRADGRAHLLLVSVADRACRGHRGPRSAALAGSCLRARRVLWTGGDDRRPSRRPCACRDRLWTRRGVLSHRRAPHHARLPRAKTRGSPPGIRSWPRR